MIIINLTGGLGNQMFQYAFGRYLSLKHGTRLKYHFTNALFNTQRSFSLDIFNIQANEATSNDLNMLGIFHNRYINRILYLLDERYKFQLNRAVVTQHFPHTFEPSLREAPDNRYIQGYFADMRYFEGIESELKREFTLKAPLDAQNSKIIKKMKSVNSVSVHIRRGDYMKNNGYIGDEYYVSSISKIQKETKDPFFYFFSDEILWCKNRFSYLKNAYFVDNNKAKYSYKDIVLMSNCKINIVANSTFSWWGAWLNQNMNKLCIRPTHHL